MPRGNKESEEEVEPKTGRRTRSTIQSVTDSPLRRSTRNRHTTKDDNSSPESVTSDLSTASKKTTRRRTPTMDSAEPVRALRSRKNSGTSDVSIAESDGGDGKRRTTRKSVASVAPDTPTKARLRRTTRAGSESKTMSPALRTTRRTRASSVDPDSTDGRATPTLGTPSRTRKNRTSVLPSQPEVVEEMEREKDKKTSEMEDDEDVFIVVDEPTEVSDHLSTSHTSIESSNKSANTSKKDIDEKTEDETREALEASLEALVKQPEPKEATPKPQEKLILENSFETRQKLMENASENAIKDLPKVMVEKSQIIDEKAQENVETSPGNKENEKSLRNVPKVFKSTEMKSSNVVLERIDVESRMNSSPVEEKLIKFTASSKKQLKSTEIQENSIIFVDDTDTDDPEKIEKSQTPRKSLAKEDENKVSSTNSSPERMYIRPATEVPSPLLKKLSEEKNPETLRKEDFEAATKTSDDKNVEADEEIVVEFTKSKKTPPPKEKEPDEANIKELFRDISAEEFAETKKADESQENSQSDGDDLVLVGKGGFSGDEDEEEVEKDKDSFNYDSDDTVIVLKKSNMQVLSRVSTIEEEEPMEVDGDDTEVEEIPASVKEMMHCSQRKSLEAKRKSLGNEHLEISENKRLSITEVDSDEEVQERRKSKNHEELLRMKELAGESKRRKSVDKVATPLRPKNGNSEEKQVENSPVVGEIVETSRKSLSSPAKEQQIEGETMDLDGEVTPEAEGSLNESRKSLNSTEKRASLSKSKTPVKKLQEDEKNEEEEAVEPTGNLNKSRNSLSSITPRKSLTKPKTPVKESKENEENDENNEEIEEVGGNAENLNSSKKKSFFSGLRLSLEKSKASSESPDPPDSPDSPSEEETEVIMKDSPDSPSEEEKEVESENSNENPVLEESLNKSGKLRKSLETSKLEESLDKSVKSPEKSSRKSLERSKLDESLEKSAKSPEKSSRKSLEASKLDESLNKSSKLSEKSRKSLEKSKLDESLEKSAKSPEKSSRKSLEAAELDESLNKSSKSSEKSRKSLESSKLNDSLNKSAKSPEKAAKLDESLNKSSKSSDKSRKSLGSSKLEKSLNESMKSPVKSRKSLPQEVLEPKSSGDDDIEEDEESPKKTRRSLSTIVQVNSDSNEEEVEESDSDVEKSRLLGSYLFQQDTTDSSDDEADDDDEDVNSDIEREYNLAGASITEYSDDNIPGDDCRDSESEASDSEDDGKDLGDFIVDDDEDVEDEDEEEEEEDENDAEKENSDEGEAMDQEEDEIDVEENEKDEDETEKLEISDDNDEENEEDEEEKEEIEEKSMKNKKKTLAVKLEDKSIDSSTPKMEIKEKEKPESAKKSKKSLNLSVQEKQTPKAAKSAAPSPIVASTSSKASPQVKVPAKASPLDKKLKSLKKMGMNQTMVEVDPELVDSRLLMKEKLNDSMPALKLKKTLETNVQEQTTSKQTPTGKNKKSKINKDRIEEEEEIEEVQESFNQSAKKKKKNPGVSVNNESKKDKSLKRKKNKEIEEPEAPKSKNRPIIVKLADSDSDEEPVMIFKTKTRGQALDAAKREKTTKEVKKIHEKVMKVKSAISNPSPVQKKTLKRLPEDVLENLSDIPQRPKKKRKIHQDIFQPSRTMFDDEHQVPSSLSIDDGYVPLSSSGGTTQFEVVNLKRIKEKKSSARAFRDKMMNRVGRRPISAFLAYQQKLKASGKNKY